MIGYITICKIKYVKNLIEPKGNYLKTENNIKKYLHSLSDKQLKNLYENIELTAFPILLAHEYKNRFKVKI